MTDDWESATFDGAGAAHRRELATATPEERLRWLGRARALAAETGALQAELERRARIRREAWDQHDA